MLKKFLTGVAKVAAAMVVAVLALAVIGYGISEYRDGARKRDAKPFEEVKTWAPKLHESLGMKMLARTKLVDGLLYAEFVLDGYPAYLSAPGLSERNAERHITVEFRDTDGFKVFEKSVEIREFTTVVGKDSTPAGLRHQFTQMVSVDDYKRWANAQVGWNLDTKPFDPDAYLASVDARPAAKPQVKPAQDHCEPGLSKAERLKRLAQHGTIRQTGMGEYQAGGRSLVYLGDTAEMYSCN